MPTHHAIAIKQSFWTWISLARQLKKNNSSKQHFGYEPKKKKRSLFNKIIYEIDLQIATFICEKSFHCCDNYLDENKRKSKF